MSAECPAPPALSTSKSTNKSAAVNRAGKSGENVAFDRAARHGQIHAGQRADDRREFQISNFKLEISRSRGRGRRPRSRAIVF